MKKLDRNQIAARVARDFTPVPLARRFLAYCEEARAR